MEIAFSFRNSESAPYCATALASMACRAFEGRLDTVWYPNCPSSPSFKGPMPFPQTRGEVRVARFFNREPGGHTFRRRVGPAMF